MKARRWVVFLLLLLSFISVCAQSKHHWTLKNGLRVYVVEDHRSPVVFSSIWYRVGSADEFNGYTGLSHMLEHMLFRGTKQNKDGAYMRAVDAAGGNANAMTSRDFTMYYSVIPKTDLNTILSLEADRMRHLIINRQLLAKEKQVVREERRMRISDHGTSILGERVNAMLFMNNPYHNPVIGWPDDIKSYTVRDLKRWYDQWYQPNNAFLVLVGDVDLKKVRSLIKREFGRIPRATLPVRKRRPEMKPLGVKRLLVHYRSELPALRLSYLMPGLAQNKNAWQVYAAEVLAGILDSTPSSRLNQHLVREKQMASTVSAHFYTLHRYTGSFDFTAAPAKGHSLAEVEQAILSEIEELQSKRVSRHELNRVKAQVVAHTVYQRDTLSQQAMNVGLPVIAGLPWKLDESWAQHIQAVTPKQVRWVARHYLVAKRLTVGYLEPLQ